MPRYSATKSIVSVASQPFSSCAMASADITADCFWSAGYFAISRSMRARASALSMGVPAAATLSESREYGERSYLVGPVIDVVLGARHVPDAAFAERADLFRIRVFA